MELFETFDRAGASLGLVARDEVHRRGLWHKSTHVFVFDPDGRMLVQRRAVDKDLYPALWDYSVGEHLLPGETFLAGAHRGLREELSIEVAALAAIGVRRWTELVGDGAIDREIQQAYRAVYSGPVEIDPVEVAEYRWASVDELRAWVQASPEALTPWFVRDLAEFDLI